MVLLQGFPNRPAAREQLALWLGEPAVKYSETFDRNLDFGTGIDEIVMVAAGAIGDRAEAHHGSER